MMPPIRSPSPIHTTSTKVPLTTPWQPFVGNSQDCWRRGETHGALDAGLIVMRVYSRSSLRQYFGTSLIHTMLEESPVLLFLYH
jgi:hypothetical protein